MTSLHTTIAIFDCGSKVLDQALRALEVLFNLMCRDVKGLIAAGITFCHASKTTF
jgi:hypothetical protein